MGRNSNHQQQQGAGAGGSQHQANELLNFHFSTPAASRQDASFSSNNNNNNSRNRSGNNGRNRNHQNNNQRRRSAQDRASVRKKADSSMFYLHSSAEHSFLLTRRSPSKMNTNNYSFHGPDESVSWESVRMVKQRVPYCDDVACPICLCDFICARISKCGHSFCLPCILRHVQTYAADNPYHPVKCPCCGIPIIVEDTRPVLMEAVRPAIVQQTFRLRKLHRQKISSAPFLPTPGAPQHSNPHFAPTTGIDADAKYSRFNYVDPELYHASLVANQGELQREMKIAIGAAGAMERIYLSLAMEIVLGEQQKAQRESAEEKSLIARFASSNSGMYQPQSPALVFEEKGNDVFDSNSSSSCHNLPSHETDIIGKTDNENGNINGNSNYDSKKTTESSLVQQRYRGDSIDSYKSIGSHKSVDTASTPCSNPQNEGSDTAVGQSPSCSSNNKPTRRKPRKQVHGSMYLDTSDAVHLYQSEDGQLVFLNGFSMTCLLSDFSKGPPVAPESLLLNDVAEDNPDKNNEGEKHRGKSHVQQAPLPDFIEGRVLEKENVHMTSEIRKRCPS